MPIIVGIAGGTASGKTTLANLIYKKALEVGDVTYIKMDDYYKFRPEPTYEERSKVNYDHPEAFDVELLVKHLNELKEGKSIQKPIYNFKIHNRDEETQSVKSTAVIIVEGIMTLAIKEVREMCDLKIYVDTDDDIRFIRRMKRDVNERGRSVDSIVNQYLTTVRPMHLTFVEPSKKYADIIVPEGGKNEVAVDLLSSKVISLITK